MAETEAKKSMDGGKSVEGAVSAVDALGALGEEGTVGEGRSAVEVQIFREDVVQNVTRPSLVGVVTKVGGDSDSEDSSESDDEEEEILEGEARVCWVNTDERTEKVGDLRVIDRALIHGDVVAKASAPLGQTGTVVNVEMLVDLELPTGEIMRDVNSRSLHRVRAIAPEDYVIYDMWIGLVEEVHDNLTVLFGDGAKCKVSRADPDRLLPLIQTGIEDLECPYFQGQKICGSASTFKSAKWLKGSWNARRTEGTVVELEAGTVVVKWISARNACYGNLQPPAIPKEEVDASRVLPIIHFSHTNWQLGDRSLPPTSKAVLRDSAQVDSIPSDHNAESPAGHSNLPSCSVSMDLNPCGTVESDKTGVKSWVLQRRESKKHRRQAKREKLNNEEEPKDFQHAVLIVNTRTTVDVLWQDGGISEGMDSCSVLPVDHLGDHEFWPEQYVMERGADGEGLDGDVPKLVGVVKVVDAKQRTASVRWLKSNLNPPEGAQKFESEEIVSVYELIEHPDFSYCLGDVVTSTGLISRPSASDGTRAEDEDSKLTASSRVDDTLEAETEDIVREDTRPKQREKSEQPITSKLESPSHDLSWVGVIIGLQDGDIEVAWANGMVSKVGPLAIRVVDEHVDEDHSSAYSDDLEDAENLNDVFSWEPVVSDNDYNGGIHNESKDAFKKCDDEKQFSGALKTANASSDEDSLPDIWNKKGTIKNFDSVKDHSDHHFIGETSQPTNNRKWIKKIQQEWSILGKNLPDSIYVRVYEDRMDLLRAVIVGAEQTPYHDGLFVFDIHLPPEYPSVPPVAHYHSGGLRLNPNLYANGKVCLSLLNTWTGSNSEIWHPLTSSILQILVSIQGLVLNAKPYFNEAGYDKQVGTGEGEKNSLSYNENSFLLTCKSMMYLIRRPPMHLEGLVRDHFHNRGHHILLASRAYLAGAEVGSLTESDFSGLEDRTFVDQSSAGFKMMLNKLFPKLASAFEVVGAEPMKPVHEPSWKQAAKDHC